MTKEEAKAIFDEHQRKYETLRLLAIETARQFPDAPYPTFARDMDRKFWNEVVTPEFDSAAWRSRWLKHFPGRTFLQSRSDADRLR